MNLRMATRSEQNLNKRPSKIRKDNTSGVKGISWHKIKNKWQVKYRGRYIGTYDKLEDAIQARKEAEQNENIQI